MLHSRLLSGALLSACGLLLATGAPAASSENSAPAAYTDWDLGDLYRTPAEWQESFAGTGAAVDRLGAYHGTLGRSAEAMLKALIAVSDLNREAGRLYV